MQFVRHLTFLRAAALAALFLCGCQGPITIPPTGTLEMSGRGILTYTAFSIGDVFVLDTNAGQSVFEGHMNKGEQIILNPAQDRLLLAGKETRHEIGMRGDHNYQIYFTAAQ